MRRLVLILLCSALLVTLSGCALFPSRFHSLERLAVVQAMGVDSDSGGVRLSLATAADSSRGEGPVRMSGRGATIRSAADEIARNAQEERLFCAHTAFLLLGEDSAREDVEAVLRYVCRSRELRMDLPLLIVRGADAAEALLESGDGRIGAAELLQALSDAAPAQDGGTLPSVSRIAGRLEKGDCALAAAIACVPSSERQEDERPLTLARAGWAVLCGGKLRAFIEPEDAPAVDLLGGAQGRHSFVVTDGQGQRVTLQTAPGHTSLRVLRDQDGAPEAIEMTVRLTASVAEIDGVGTLSDAAYADELSALLERELLRRAAAVLRLERELGADFLCLRERAGLDTDELPPIRLSVSVRVSHANDVRDG